MIDICDSNIQLRRLPNALVKNGIGNLSTNGAQTNLNEYPKAAQLKNVTEDLLTPASRSHKPNDEKINKIGTPAEKPRKSIVITRGCLNAFMDSSQDWDFDATDVVIVFYMCRFYEYYNNIR